MFWQQVIQSQAKDKTLKKRKKEQKIKSNSIAFTQKKKKSVFKLVENN